MGDMFREEAALQVWKAGKRSKQSPGPTRATPIEEDHLSRGLCVFWNDIYNIDVYFWCDSYIKTGIVDGKGNAWACNFIYNNSNFGRKRKQWRKITTTNCNKVEPQHFIGDFNDVLTQKEKMDLKGDRFTWFSNPRNEFVTKEKIDRALVNSEWRFLFENASFSTMSAISLDHCLLILNPKLVYRINKSFKFKAFCAYHQECENIIKKGWEKEISQNCEWTRITRRMNNCKKNLKK
ncbi:hypothetical protein Ahy_B05g079746 [Arachis hypogaea]|uniref:Endonuclease/exonuclease/phosphatase domain-containing protein n=1 Tax=Arachis hypogaea TaxID=3818 RepID=A0A444ZAS3_ARAHY|nr:hypothetical protein Ahy_B05g079746 [Arachis hypogaea]